MPARHCCCSAAGINTCDLIREALGVRVIARGDTVHLKGEPEQIGQAQRVFEQLRNIVQQQQQLSSEDVRTVLDVVQHGGDRLVPQDGKRADGGRYVRPRTDGQGAACAQCAKAT